MPRKQMAYLLLATILTLLAPATGLAHKVKIFATTQGATINGFAYYPGGGKYMNSTVSVNDQAGHRVAELQTDEQGAFAFTPPGGGTYTFTIATQDGHKAEFRVETAGRGTTTSPLPPTTEPPSAKAKPGVLPIDLTTLIDKSVARQINPLREDIARYEQKVRLHDIIGGIGYIFGLFGLFTYLQNRKREQ